MTLALIFIAIGYISLLFWLATKGDRQQSSAQHLARHPWVYGLSLAIYCRTWTFYGAVGTAANAGWQFLPILLGPILLYVGFTPFIRKLVNVSKKQNITTIADFIAARYGKRAMTGILVTVIALLATIPYIALQLKALSSSFALLQPQQGALSGTTIAFGAALLMAAFAMAFGTRKTDVTEYRSGLMLAIAFESSIKLIALLAVAGLALWFMVSQPQGLASHWQQQISQPQWRWQNTLSLEFWGQTFIAAAAVICLPRQFHVTVVDNHNPNHINTARWLFPLYLLLICLAIIPIAIASGHPALAGNAEGVHADNFVLALPLAQQHYWLAVLVFIGGLSAATAMIVVATLTLSTMVSNDVLLPLLLKRRVKRLKANASLQRKVILVRRFSITAVLLMAYFYQQLTGSDAALASMGLVAFSLVTQLLPAIVGGLYWRQGHAYGVYAGLATGTFCWLMFLMMPLTMVAAEHSAMQQSIIVQGTLASLVANTIAYISVSLLAQERLIDKIQAAAFVTPKQQFGNHKALIGRRVKTSVEDLRTLLQTFLGQQRTEQLLLAYPQYHELDANAPTFDFVQYCERALAGVLGASSARSLMSAVLSGRQMAFEDVVTFFDETTQAIQFNQNVLYASLENISQGISVVDRDLKLVAWNKPYLQLFDYPEGLVQVGQPIAELIRFNAQQGECGPGDLDELVRKRLQHMKNGTPHHFIRRRSDGKVIEMVGKPLPDGGFVTSFSDVTLHIETQLALEEANIDLEKRIAARTQEIRAINHELQNEIDQRKDIEQALMQAKAEAEQANASKTRFLALASHDILQPLNAARLYLASFQAEQWADSDRHVLGKLTQSLDSTEHLLSTLLEIAKLEQGALAPKLSHFRLRDIIDPLYDEFAIFAKEKGLSLRLRTPDVVVHSDKTYLRRILQNLISNAVKYTEHGGVLIAIRLRQQHNPLNNFTLHTPAVDSSPVTQPWLEIKVVDTGPGISEHERAKIFSDFYRIPEQKQQGVGLGLGVVQRLVQLLGLRLRLQSTVGHGSCLT